jgi:hypothetical protein
MRAAATPPEVPGESPPFCAGTFGAIPPNPPAGRFPAFTYSPPAPPAPPRWYPAPPPPPPEYSLPPPPWPPVPVGLSWPPPPLMPGLPSGPVPAPPPAPPSAAAGAELTTKAIIEKAGRSAAGAATSAVVRSRAATGAFRRRRAPAAPLSRATPGHDRTLLIRLIDKDMRMRFDLIDAFIR